MLLVSSNTKVDHLPVSSVHGKPDKRPGDVSLWSQLPVFFAHKIHQLLSCSSFVTRAVPHERAVVKPRVINRQ